MAHSEEIPQTLITKLQRAYERALAEPEGTVKDARPMSQAIGFSWVTLRDWFDSIPAFESSDCFVRGGQGIAWEIKPAPTIKIILDHYLQERERRIGNTKKDSPKKLKLPDDVTSTSDLTKRYALIKQVNAEERLERECVNLANFAEINRGRFRGRRDRVLSIPTRFDPTGQHDPILLDHLTQICEAVMMEEYEDEKDFVRKLRASFESGENIEEDI